MSRFSYMKALRSTFSKRRHLLGMKQDEVATAAGLARKTVSDFENGKTSMTVGRLIKLMRVVGLELTTREASSRPTLDELADRYPDEEPGIEPRHRVRKTAR